MGIFQRTNAIWNSLCRDHKISYPVPLGLTTSSAACSWYERHTVMSTQKGRHLILLECWTTFVQGIFVLNHVYIITILVDTHVLHD